MRVFLPRCAYNRNEPDRRIVRICIRYICLDRVRQLSGAWVARYYFSAGNGPERCSSHDWDSRSIL